MKICTKLLKLKYLIYTPLVSGDLQEEMDLGDAVVVVDSPIDGVERLNDVIDSPKVDLRGPTDVDGTPNDVEERPKDVDVNPKEVVKPIDVTGKPSDVADNPNDVGDVRFEGILPFTNPGGGGGLHVKKKIK